MLAAEIPYFDIPTLNPRFFRANQSYLKHSPPHFGDTSHNVGVYE
jgi:hypothetical protein